MGAGGALFIDSGNVTVTNVTFSDNRAIGGTGGAGTNSTAGGGGGGLRDDATGSSGGFDGGGDGGAIIFDDGDNGGFGGGGGGSPGNTAGNGGFGGGGGGGASANDFAGDGGFGAGRGRTGAEGGGGGGAGLGGAIFIRSGTLTLDNTTFNNNSAVEGNGGIGNGENGKGLGGAIFAVTDDLKGEAGVTTAPTVLSLGGLPTFTNNTATDNGGDSIGSTYDDNNIFGTLEIVPSLSINDVQVNENAGTAIFTVSLSSPAPTGGVTFDIATADSAATAGEDYTAQSLTSQTIAAGQSTYTFNVDIKGGNLAAAQETFFVNITNVTGANVLDGQGLGAIANVNEVPTDITLLTTLPSPDFNNPTSIAIPGSDTFGIASLYPSTINVSNVPGTITDITVTLNGLSHTFPDDIDALLVGPTGQQTILMCDTGFVGVLLGINVSFSNLATKLLPDTGLITPGIYLPTDFQPEGPEDIDVFETPAPSGPYPVGFSDFIDTDPNGTWSLYVVDDFKNDIGSLSGGWTISFTTKTTGNIQENIITSSGFLIGLLDVIDPDATGNNNVLTVEGTDAGDFEIRNGNELFFVGSSPDFETKPNYKITIKSTDSNGGSPLTFTKDLTIDVVNVNEAPTDITISNNKINENINTTSGIKVAIVTITDPDFRGNNNVLTVEGTDAGEFEIRNSNELFFIGASPDFETKPSYAITIKSTDANSGSLLTLTKDFTITVNNLDEVAPTITSGDTATAIKENSGAGQVIYIATADDSKDISAGVTFALKPGDDASDFTIDSTSGKVTLTGNPDFESQSSYKFTVTADDGVNSATEQLVSLTINNLDEVAPTITSGNIAKAIDENSGANKVIYQVTADDSADISAGVIFGLKPGDDATSFSIDSTTGKVTLIGNPNFEDKPSYKFTVTADDGVNPATEKLISLTITNLDEIAPTITSGDTAKAIAENSGAGQIIYQAKADDGADISAGVTFGLKPEDDSDSFTINPTTGEVTLIEDPDFEIQSSYKFTVAADDGVNPATEQLVNLTINNLDEIAPAITSGNTAKEIAENSGAGQIVYQVTADDSADISAGVIFGLKAGEDSASFRINSVTGKVTLIDNPNFEAQSSYQFTVTANDGVNFVNEKLISLTINDVDESGPNIISKGTATVIDENSGANQIIYQVIATDNVDISAGITFGLKAGDDADLFTIDPITGEVILTEDPNFETKPSYKFTVTASDGVNLAIEQLVNLSINDIDEIAPTITSGNTATSIDENSGVGEVVHTVTADDSKDISAGVTFGLKAGDDDDLFTINPITGQVILTEDPDFETQSSYKFTVTASDGVNPATEQLVNLTIIDLDEVPPTITSGNTAKAIAENSGANQVIYKVTADDSADISAGVTFGLKPGDDADLFIIDPTTREVTLTEDPDFETQSSYKFTITAGDGVNPVTEQQIALEILDDNVAVVENGFFFAQFLDNTRQALLFQNQPFSAEQSANWEILDTETINGLNQVLWYNQGTEEVGIWLTDNNWNWISSDTWQVKSSRTFNTELLFGTDINGDSLIGDQYTVVENQGGVSLLEGIFGAYYVQPEDDLVTPIKFLGEPFENQFVSWQALAAERIENINRVLWQNSDTGEIGIWRTDNNWNWLSSNVFTPNSTEIATVESLFGISL